MPKTLKNNFTFVVGLSMYPTLRPGDEAVSLTNSSITAGDIIGYKQKNKNILHRIIKIEKEKIYTKGDNSLAADPYPIQKKDIIGKLTKIRRGTKIYRINNGWLGFLTERKCLIIKKTKNSLIKLITPIYNSEPIVCVMSKIGQKVCHNRFSVVRQSRNFFLIYCGKIYCGFYDYDMKKWTLRNRYKLFFSKAQLQSIMALIDKKNN